MSKIQLFALLVSIAFILAIFQLVRKKKLKEQYSLMWFLIAAVITVLAVWEPLLGGISSALGISVPSNALFLLALLFLFGLALHFSMLVSRLTDQSQFLAQKLALLERDLRQRESAGGVATSTAEADDEPA
ncbi:MAG: DUF2304 domain-containing protein [Thermoleophilia bacterium]